MTRCIIGSTTSEQSPVRGLAHPCFLHGSKKGIRRVTTDFIHGHTSSVTSTLRTRALSRRQDGVCGGRAVLSYACACLPRVSVSDSILPHDLSIVNSERGVTPFATPANFQEHTQAAGFYNERQETGRHQRCGSMCQFSCARSTLHQCWYISFEFSKTRQVQPSYTQSVPSTVCV